MSDVHGEEELMDSEQSDSRKGPCHFCGLEIEGHERVIQSNNTPGVWAHVTCWYDGGPFEREVRGLERRKACRS